MDHNFLCCEIRQEFCDLINVFIIIPTWRAFIFSSDLTMISYFNVTINTSIIQRCNKGTSSVVFWDLIINWQRVLNIQPFNIRFLFSEKIYIFPAQETAVMKTSCFLFFDRTSNILEEPPSSGVEGFCRGHEIFLAHNDGPWNIFEKFWWASKYNFMFFLVLTFSKSISKFKWVLAKNVQTDHQLNLRKTRHVKQQIKYFELHDNGWY